MDETFFPGLKQCFVSNPLETGLETRGLKQALKQALKHVLFQTPVSSLFQAPCFKACFKPFVKEPPRRPISSTLFHIFANKYHQKIP